MPHLNLPAMDRVSTAELIEALLAENARLRAELSGERRPTISILRACEVVGVSRRTIYNWLESGKIAAHRTGEELSAAFDQPMADEETV